MKVSVLSWWTNLLFGSAVTDEPTGLQDRAPQVPICEIYRLLRGWAFSS